MNQTKVHPNAAPGVTEQEWIEVLSMVPDVAEFHRDPANVLQLVQSEDWRRAENVYRARIDLSGFDFGAVNLSDEDLGGAFLRNCEFGDSDLTEAVLSNADISGANLPSGSYTRRLRLDGACLDSVRGASCEVPRVTSLAASVLQIVETDPAKFDMIDWEFRASCGTTRCLAGWAIYFASATGRQLAEEMGSNVAGALIWWSSERIVPDFFDTNEGASRFLRTHVGKVGCGEQG